MYVHLMGTTCGYMHMYLCAIKGGSTENQSRGNSICTESCQCTLCEYSMRNKNPKSLQETSK